MKTLLPFLFAIAFLFSCKAPSSNTTPPKQIAIAEETRLSDHFAGKLLQFNSDTKKLTTATIPDHVSKLVFYFSAHWCPPCRKFTPELVKWYKEHHQEDSDWQLIFVSSDHSAKAMQEYATEYQMPWLILEHSFPAEILDPIRPSSIPCTALVDQSGKLVSHSFDASGTYTSADTAIKALEHSW